MQYILGKNIIKSNFTLDFMSTAHSIENYVLQVTGEETYIVGDVRLLDFKAVRRCRIQNY